MAVTKRLEMRFRNAAGRTVTISVPDPRDDLTVADVETAMNTIISKNVFNSSGGDLVTIASARIVERVTTDIIEG
ncbi:MAG: DUF2922 domain-containing protein [Peptococcaceae bacterium]|nr:DUF2922 domain-containing protein [Peptococcaceae bacterium]